MRRVRPSSPSPPSDRAGCPILLYPNLVEHHNVNYTADSALAAKFVHSWPPLLLMDTTSRDEAVCEVFNPYELAGYLATLKPAARKKLQKPQQGAPNPFLREELANATVLVLAEENC